MYNEEDTIYAMCERLVPECEKLKENYEIIFVDDGSTDNTIELLSKLQSRKPAFKIIKLSRNYGHQLALSAGLDCAQGLFTITMDSDLQHPPELIHYFLDEAEKGYDIVSGVKEYTVGRGFLKDALASVYYKILKKITNINVEPNASDFRLYSKKALSVIKNMRERERYLRGLAEWVGFKQNTIQYVCRERYAGKPKYTIKKLAKLGSYGIFAFSAFPLRVAAYIGIAIIMFNVLYMMFALYAWIRSPESVPGYTSLIIFILFLFSWLFIALGILGEYVLRIYEEVKERPLYVVDWTRGFDSGDPHGE